LNRNKLALALLICLLIAALVSGCASANQEEGTNGTSGVAGFGAGLWHGLILPVAFIASLFDDSIGIYEIHNNGSHYDAGFVLGTWIIFGMILATNKGRR